MSWLEVQIAEESLCRSGPRLTPKRPNGPAPGSGAKGSWRPLTRRQTGGRAQRRLLPVGAGRRGRRSGIGWAPVAASVSAPPDREAVEAERGPAESAAPSLALNAGKQDDPLPLPAALDLAAANALTRALLARRGRTVVIDAAAVLHLSAPCAQVLMSAAATWLADDAPFSIENCGERMMDDLRVLGIAPSVLNIEVAAP